MAKSDLIAFIKTLEVYIENHPVKEVPIKGFEKGKDFEETTMEVPEQPTGKYKYSPKKLRARKIIQEDYLDELMAEHDGLLV